jgi:hypothetical protein
MADDSRHAKLAAAMHRINRSWLDGRVDDLAALVHPEIVLVFPGFAGRAQGRDELLAGFRDFCHNATVHEFREHEHQTDIAGGTAVVSFQFEMVYERAGKRSRATGRDLWVFEERDGEWIAVWRTMIDMDEHGIV